MKCNGALILFIYISQFWISTLNGHQSSGKKAYKDYVLTEGIVCRIDSVTMGKCKKTSSCNSLSKSQKRNPKLCSWKKNIPIICCPKQTVQRPKAERLKISECGIRPFDVKRRNQMISKFNRTDINYFKISLVGGSQTLLNSWPWMVSIHRRTGQLSQYLCGGCIISDRHILTAAHCFAGNNRSPSNHFVKVAGHKKTDGVNYDLKWIRSHFMYKRNQHYYDIALLQVKSRIRFDDKTSPACLPSKKDKYTNEIVTILGWGDTSFGGLPSDVLREANVKIMSNNACNKSYSRLSLSTFPRGITNNLLCAGIKEGGVDACQGDSGGPLMLKDPSSSKWKVIGVVSFGYQCAIAGYPGVYTRVSKFLPWIAKNTQ